MKHTLSLNDYIKSQLFPLLVRLAGVVLLYSFFRLVFFMANLDNFPNAELSIFFYGIRFDIFAIFYSNIPYIIAVLLPFSFCYHKIYRKIFDLYFIIVNCIAALVSFIDVAYYPYVYKRMTCDIFAYVQIGFDFQTLIPSFLKQFWYLLLIFVATIFAVIFLVRFTNKMIHKKPVLHPFLWKELLGKILLFALCMGLTFIGLRGGIQLRPLGLIDTGKYTSLQNSALISNTPFTLMKSYGMRHDNIEKQYFKSLEEAEAIYTPIINHIVPCSSLCYPTKNVVVIILESFSQYLIHGMEWDKSVEGYQGYCPFLDSLSRQSISFNGIANGYRTIESLPSIFGGIPKLLNTSIVETTFANNYTHSPVQVLKDKGFNTPFFHGAENGSMNIESYCYSIGFDSYYGKNEYPNPADDDGCWGISDRPYLKYVAQQLNTMRQPFFASVLTLSSHNPYIIPKDAVGLDIKNGTHPIHAAASYTDHAVREFFEALSQYSWYDSTLFVITADHTGAGSIPKSDNIYITTQIPIMLYHPQAKENMNMGAMQQLDIMPTIFSYLNMDEPLFSYGNNRFDASSTTYSPSFAWGVYQLISEEFMLQFDGEKSIGFFNVKEDIMISNNLLNELPDEVALYEQKLKAIIQSYTTRLIKNKLYK